MEEKINYLKFSQDFSSLALGTEEGYGFLSVENFGKRDNDHIIATRSGVRLVERMFSSNLAAVVPVGSPRTLLLLNISSSLQLCKLFFSSSILSVRMNKKRLVVLLENKIYIYEVREMKVSKEIVLPWNNERFIELSTNSDLLAYPIMEQSGIVELFDTETMQKKTKILAHASAVASVALNTSGTLLATASEKGTLIRVFSTSEGTRVFEFRRGIMRNAAIQSMVFSADGTFLAASSDTSTIHIFKLNPSREVEEVDNSWTGWFKASLASIPQNPVTEKLLEERAFATISTPVEGARKSVLGFRTFPSDNQPLQQQLCVLVASYDGVFKIYSLNTQQGGECTLLKQHLFVQQSPHHHGSSPGSEATSPTSAFSALTQSALPGNIPDLINQASVNINYGYGLIQSVLTDAANTLFDKTQTAVSGAMGTSSSAPPAEQEVEQELPRGLYDSYGD